ncbi:hypothetical protein FQN50_008671 [Emmonsiellopsis sp. PD_5]|nr:hypothetical protein FQN50_008671 [Emmonsiellopsis sp. PD_5]
MSYAEAASLGAHQSPKEDHEADRNPSRPPQPRQVTVADSPTTTSSLVDVDSPHVASVPPDFESQEIKTTTQAERISREDAEQEKKLKEGEEAMRNAANANAAAARRGKKGVSTAKARLRRNKTNPVVVGNALLIAVAGAGLGFGAWQKHVQGALTWRLIGLWSGAVGAVGVVDYWVSKWLFQNKYPPE